MTTGHFVDGIEVAWRPGCPFCVKLRSALRVRGVNTTETNIYTDGDAAARVRAAAGGNETVPTVFIGSKALVNPSARQVIATAKAELPGRDDLYGRGSLLSRALKTLR